MRDWLNYHHLQYFWVTAHEGSLTRASQKLRLAPSTISAQIRALESALGQPLFLRRGRYMELSETGRIVLEYADQIFALGQALSDSLDPDVKRTPPLRLGIVRGVPERLVQRMIAPVLAAAIPLRCQTADTTSLLSDLALHRLDAVISDSTALPATSRELRRRSLGDCGVDILAAPAFAGLVDAFPASLAGAPWVVPGSKTPLRQELETVFVRLGIRPPIAAEVSDRALAIALGCAGVGLVAVPAVTSPTLTRPGSLVRLGTFSEIRFRFYAITVDNRVPGVLDAMIDSLDKIEGFVTAVQVGG